MSSAGEHAGTEPVVGPQPAPELPEPAPVPPAAAAPEAEQDKRAAMLLQRAGTSPWPVCG